MDVHAVVDLIMFYTRSNHAHNRQIVAVMVSGIQHRFTEGQMRRELDKSKLPESTLRNIELSAYRRAMRFDQDTDDWPKVQKLMCEFQDELDRLYG